MYKITVPKLIFVAASLINLGFLSAYLGVKIPNLDQRLTLHGYPFRLSGLVLTLIGGLVLIFTVLYKLTSKIAPKNLIMLALLLIALGLISARLGDQLSTMDSQGFVHDNAFLMLGGIFLIFLGQSMIFTLVILKVWSWLRK